MPTYNVNTPPLVYAYGSVAYVTNGSTSYTYTNMSIGTASIDRTVVVALACSNVATLTAASIAGINATLVYSSGYHHFFAAVVPTGTTATINITFDTTVTRVQTTTWSIYMLKSLVPFSSNVTNTSGTSISTTVNKTIGGVILATLNYNTSVQSAATFSNLTTYAESGTTGYSFQAAAAAASCLDSNSITISATLSGTNPSVLSLAAIVLR
jgi:hypothetical protein